jgi:hypothetical protein
VQIIHPDAIKRWIVQVVHCVLVMALAVATVVFAARVPKEFTGGDFIVVCLVVICILAFTWICFAYFAGVDDDD